MIPRPSILKLWLANTPIAAIFVGGMWLIGIPLSSPYVMIFLAIVLPPFFLIAAVAESSYVSNRIDQNGISCPYPYPGFVSWQDVKSVRRQWPFLRVGGPKAQSAFLPMPWLVKNREEFTRALSAIEVQNHAVSKLKRIAAQSAAAHGRSARNESTP